VHVPDGFLDAPTSLATGAIALGAVGFALRRAQPEIDRTGPALPGITAAFVFATQMVNFPVGAGTSGHLLGGALAAALVGPWTAVLVMATVLTVQALLFADGGLTALGTNITLMAVVGVAVGYAVTRAVLAVLPRRPRSVVPAAAIGAFVSVPTAALAFTALYAVGGVVPIPLPTLATAMLGWHAVIGIGEAVITAAVLGAVVAVRPDLVHAARHLTPGPVLLGSDGTPLTDHGSAFPAPLPDAPAAPVTPHLSLRVLARPGRRTLTTGLLAALIVGGVVSLAASAHPDGLEFVASTLGFDGAARTSLAAGSPLADYGVSGLDGAAAAVPAGVVGVLLTVALAAAIARVVQRRRAVDSRGAAPTAAPADARG
jgi:cobalt/nickel transport system permease protein